MQYVMVVRVDPQLAASRTDGGDDDPTDWVEEGTRTALRVEGGPLEDPGTATTVRVRQGRTIVADGPFVETKEIVVGYDLLEAPDLGTAVDYASRHPLARIGALEVREVWADFVERGDAAPEPRAEGVDYLFLHAPCVDGPVEQDRDPESLLTGWIDGVERSGASVGGARLRDADERTAATVRNRGDGTLVTRGPFAEVAEQIAGIDRIRVADLDEAIAVASAHPTARLGAIEIRALTGL